MKQKFQNLCLGFLALFSTVALAQQSPVSVNNLTGTAGVHIPLFTVTSGKVSVPVSVNYTASGVKVKDVEGSAGMNWQLSAGGAVTRMVRGLPDDCKLDAIGNTRLGWLYGAASAVGSFSVANDNNTSTCTDEAADLSYISTYLSANDLDTEPDMFYVNAPGLSCQLVFGNDLTVRTIPYMDVKVTYTTAVDGEITKFTITNNNGITYTFGDPSAAMQTTTSSSPSSIAYFKKRFDQYRYGIIYNYCWNLTAITDADRNAVTFIYDTYSRRAGRDPITTIVATPSGTTTTTQYTIVNANDFHKLVSISSGHDDDIYTERISLSYNISSSGIPLISSVTGYGKSFAFQYMARSPIAGSSGVTRPFLSSIWDGASGPTYTFDYYRTSNDAVSPFTARVALPDSSSKEIDYWGYYNASSQTSLVPSIYINPSSGSYERYRFTSPGSASSSFSYSVTGTDRSANTNTVVNGSLSQITYKYGGYTKLAYESNDYVDATAAAVISGGGLRIKSITDYDGIDSTKKMIQQYYYTDPSTGVSSGKPVSLPQFAFTQPYTGSYGTTSDFWNYSTVRTEEDLSDDAHTIIYGTVKVARPGAGSSVYTYSTPATSWDTSSGSWSPTVANIARPSCTSYGLVANATRAYPFAPDPNYDHERGLLMGVKHYDEAGPNLVSSSTYTYSPAASAIAIAGLRYETVGGVTAYSRYTINTQANELLAQVDNKIYDLAAGTNRTTTVNYTYNSYQQIGQTQTTNSDGSVTTQYQKYAKDYNVSTHSDAMTTALYQLQQLNINAPVEQYTTVTRGGATKTYSGQLTRYGTFSNPYYVDTYAPAQSQAFRSSAGLTGFSASSASAGTFAADASYQTVANFLSYDYRGILTTADHNDRMPVTILTDHWHLQPVATFKNAKAGEVTYTNFDNNLFVDGLVMVSGTYTYSTNSRTGGHSLSLASSTVLHKSLARNANAQAIVFSAWVNITGSGTLSATVNDGVTSRTVNIALSGSGTWKYYQTAISLSSIGSTFDLSLQTNAAVLIDDILAYPDIAEARTVAYDDISLQKTAETDNNGVAAYYSYDALQRPQYVYDQDKNITKRMYYMDVKNTAPSLSIGHSGTASYASPETFFNSGGVSYPLGTYTVGMTYTWNFGDGTSAVTINGSNPTTTHTYSAAGTYTVTLTLASPLYGTSSTTASVTIGSGSPTPVGIYSQDNPHGNGVVNSVDVYDSSNTTLIDSFTASQMLAGTATVTQGVYYFRVHVNGTSFNSSDYSGYKRLLVNINSTYFTCDPYFSSGNQTYTYHLDLNGKSSVQFVMDIEATCAPVD